MYRICPECVEWARKDAAYAQNRSLQSESEIRIWGVEDYGIAIRGRDLGLVFGTGGAVVAAVGIWCCGRCRRGCGAPGWMSVWVEEEVPAEAEPACALAVPLPQRQGHENVFAIRPHSV